jgi:hypothetical protein
MRWCERQNWLATDPSYEIRAKKQPICDSLFCILCGNCGEFLTDLCGEREFLATRRCERRNTKQKETLKFCTLALVVPCGAGVALIYFT